MSLNPLDGLPLTGWISNQESGESDEEPKKWDNPGFIARVKQKFSRNPMFYGGLTVLFISLLVYFAPIIPTAHFDPLLGLVVLFAVYSVGIYLMGRSHGVSSVKDLDLRAIYQGDRVRYALGKRKDTSSGMGFTPLKKFGKYGIRKEFLTIKDYFGRREISEHKNKYQRLSGDGNDHLVDRLNPIATAESDVEENDVNNILGSVMVSHAHKMDDDLTSKTTDREVTPPPVYDRRTSKQIRLFIRDMDVGIQEAQRQKRQMAQSLEQLDQMVDERARPYLDDIATFLSNVGLIDQGKNREGERLDIDVGIDEEARENAEERRGG